MVPTIGRRMYFFAATVFMEAVGLTSLREGDPFDAGVVFVNDDGTVNLQVTDHVGKTVHLGKVEVFGSANPDGPKGNAWVEWMPYQKEQAAKQEHKVSEVDSNGLTYGQTGGE